MKELHLTMKLRNNLIRKRREELGLKPRELAAKVGITYQRLLEFEGLRCFPLTVKGDWRPSALRLARFFDCSPEALFPDVIMAVQKPEVTAEIEGEKALALAQARGDAARAAPNPRRVPGLRGGVRGASDRHANPAASGTSRAAHEVHRGHDARRDRSTHRSQS